MGELVATWPTSHPVDRAIVQVQPIVAVRPVQLTSPVIAATVVAMKSAPRYYVQVGAPRSVALADSTWRRIKGSSPALLASLPRRFEPSVVRGVRYYRILVGGFARQADAAGLCGRLAQANLACIIRARRDG
jgi:cell division protein FtsN